MRPIPNQPNRFNTGILLGAALLLAPAPSLFAQTTIPASMKVPASQVDTSAVGLKIRTWQIDPTSGDNQGVNATTEAELAGLLGPNIAETADPNYTYDPATGYFDFPYGLNCRASGSADNGLFVDPNTDRPIPGLPGTTGSTEQAACEAITFLEFKAAGLYEMAVQSDDNFRIMSWYNPKDRFALMIGEQNAPRGIAETRVMLLKIEEPGIYPFRCIYGNRTGSDGWEWYFYAGDGSGQLVGDPNNTVAKGYRVGPMRPYVSSVFPDVGVRGASPATEIIATIKDDGLQVDSSSIAITLNNGATAGTFSATKDGGVTTAKFVPAALLALGSTNTVKLVYADQGTPSVSVTNTWTFIVSTVTVSPNAAVADAQVNKNVLGFSVFTHQLLNTDFQNGAALANIRDQLQGIRGANQADLSLADSQGYFWLTNSVNGKPGPTNWVNFNNFYTQTEKGNFTASTGTGDAQFPGMPGSGGYETYNADNIATETLTYVEFPAPGGYTMGVQSWDSFQVTIGDDAGRSPKDLFSTVLAQYDGDAPGNYLFSFYVPTAGIYPVVLTHNVGLNDGYLEWFSANATATTLSLINGTNGLKGYLHGPALPAYVRRVSPGANVAGIQTATVTGVLPDATVSAEIADEGTTVSPGNVSLKLNGVGTATVTKSGKITTATLPSTGGLLPGSTNVATLTYTDSAGKSFTDTWTFVVLEAFFLDPAMSYPLGSGDAAKAGFAVRTLQLGTPFVSGENGSSTLAEALLAGVFLNGTNVANLDDTTYPMADGWFHLDKINFGSGADPGVYNLITPDDPVPAVPGKTGDTTHYANEVRAYVELPKAGVYNMTLYSDDSPRMYQAEAQDQHFGALEIVSPCSLAGTRIAMSATWVGGAGGGFGSPVPTNGLVLNLVAADPVLGNESPLKNAAAIDGNACILQRGGGIAFGIKAANAKAAGAKAVIIFNNNDGDRADRPPIYMGGTAAGVDIPCIFIGYRDGTNVMSLLANGPLVVNFQENPKPMIVDGEGYYGYWDFSLYAPQPGVYPFRIVTKQGGAGYGLEWTVRKADGTRVLVNDPADTEALKAFRTVKQAPQFLPPVVGSGCNPVEISWRGSGKLLEATNPAGPYTPSADQSMPHLGPTTGTKFFKLQQMQ